MVDGVSEIEGNELVDLQNNSSDEKLSKENVQDEAFRLEGEFEKTFKELPEFNKAVAEKYWNILENKTSISDHYVRFIVGDQRYAVRIDNVGFPNKDMVIKRRPIDGIDEEGDTPGTSSEDLNENYWSEILVLNTGEPGSNSRATIKYHGTENNKKTVSDNTAEAFRKADGLLEQFRRRLPNSSQVIAGESKIVDSTSKIMDSLPPGK